MPQFIGRLSFKHLKDEPNIEDAAAQLCLSFVAESSVEASCFVYEVGDCGEPHAHFYFQTQKSDGTIRRLLRKHFRLPEKVCLMLCYCWFGL